LLNLSFLRFPAGVLLGALLSSTLLQAQALRVSEPVKVAAASFPSPDVASNGNCQAERAAYAAAYADYLEAVEAASAALLALQICEVIDPEVPEEPGARALRLEQLASMKSVLER
jgi:hypothetical protein